ncbi:LacI family DNA-binding transcriptional regulator [Vibrio marisflavi]|uniref:Catabolite control protein A n=1 Tax=Vibrio marisflavi CECT 7928 TaxID=634439 RepID=A0ABN8DX45_9VIBR|nr:LacI family DNA-binding transcriptional regulator [Vibrio marisflavi]CAH0536115.1 Catabolite control protein A [Vibrio marisflavi CECT 7928]
MKRKITSSDVAAYVGVSRSAVSRAFTKGASIHAAKRDRILKAAKELGYHPNIFARTLSTPGQNKRSNLVAVLVAEVSNCYESYLFEKLSTELQKHGKQPILMNIKHPEEMDEAILRLSGYQVDGVIAIAGSLPEESFVKCLELSLPMVTLGRADDSGHVPFVKTDNFESGRLVAKYFASEGVQKVGYVSGLEDGMASRERHEGLKSVFQELGLEQPVLIPAGSYSYGAGYEAAKQNLQQIQKLDGLFCACDALALGVSDCCKIEANMQIPNDLRLVGCDDIPQAAWEGYKLTTVAQPVDSIVMQVISLLDKLWSDEEDIPSIVKLAPNLVIRNT